jgi:hypothetical protein
MQFNDGFIKHWDLFDIGVRGNELRLAALAVNWS